MQLGTAPLRHYARKITYTHTHAHEYAHTHTTPSGILLNIPSLVDLGGEVELQMAILGPLDVILHKEWCIGTETNLNLAAKRRGLCEVDEVAQRKGGGHILMDSEDDLVF